VKIADAPKLDRFLRAFGAVEALLQRLDPVFEFVDALLGALAVGDRVGPALLFGLGAAFVRGGVSPLPTPRSALSARRVRAACRSYRIRDPRRPKKVRLRRRRERYRL